MQIRCARIPCSSSPAALPPGRAGASFGVSGLLLRIVRKLKLRFPSVQISLRGDGAFATPTILRTVEELNTQFGDVSYLLGLPKNSRLETLLAPTMEQAR